MQCHVPSPHNGIRFVFKAGEYEGVPIEYVHCPGD